MKLYTVEYLMNEYEEARSIIVEANSKIDAYLKAQDIFMDIVPYTPYATWVAGVTYNNGNYKRFNTFAGNPY